MSKLFIPKDYTPVIDYMESQVLLKKSKIFSTGTCLRIESRRVSAPLFVTPESGLNDNLERN